MMKTKTIGLGVLLSVAAAAMCFAGNPTLGTWKLNEGKSTFGDGAGKSTLVVWEKVGDQHKCTVDGTDAEGKKIHTVWTGKLDGKDYPRAVQAQKKVDDAARIVAARLRKYGRVPLQEVFRMRGFAVKRFPKWETEQMPKDEIAKLERELREAGILGQ